MTLYHIKYDPKPTVMTSNIPHFLFHPCFLSEWRGGGVRVSVCEEIVLTLIVQLILPYDAISIPMTPFTIQNDLKRPVLTSDIPHCFIPATSSGNTGAASLSK